MNIFCISKGYWLINYDLWALGIKQNLCAVDTPDTSLLIELMADFTSLCRGRFKSHIKSVFATSTSVFPVA